MIVVKFGGSLLRGAGDYVRAAEVVRELLDLSDVVVVVSAMKGVTSRLVEIAARGDAGALGALVAEHLSTLEAVGGGEGRSERVLRVAREARSALRAAAAGDRAAADVVLSIGERMSVAIMEGALARAGVAARALDGGEAGVITDELFGRATPVLDECLRAIPASLRPLLDDGVVPVVAGFTGVTRGGRVTTLGRGGSDLTASLVASAMGASELRLLTDVPGVMTGDPALLSRAKTVPAVSLAEASAMAKLGVKKFHPLTFEPVRQANPGLEIFVGRPEGAGTRVVPKRVPPPLKAVALAGSLVAAVGHGAHLVEAILDEASLEAEVEVFEEYALIRARAPSEDLKVLSTVHEAILGMMGVS